MAEQLSWMAEPWVPGAWDLQLFLQGKLLGRGRERVPLGAGRRAVSASSSLEGDALTPLRRYGLLTPLRALRHLHCASRTRAPSAPRSDSSTPRPNSLEVGSRARADVMIPLDTVTLTSKRSC